MDRATTFKWQRIHASSSIDNKIRFNFKHPVCLVGHQVYVFNCAAEYNITIFKLDTNSHSWSHLVFPGTEGLWMGEISATLIDEKVYLYRTRTVRSCFGSPCYGHLFRFDLVALEQELLMPDEDPPLFRWNYHLAHFYEKNSMILYIGRVAHPRGQQTVVDALRLREMKWEDMRVKGASPGTSGELASCMERDRLFVYELYDGVAEAVRNESLIFVLRLDNSCYHWDTIRPANTPFDCVEARLFSLGGDRLLLLGGRFSDRTDLFVLEGTLGSNPKWVKVEKSSGELDLVGKVSGSPRGALWTGKKILLLGTTDCKNFDYFELLPVTS